MKLYEILKVVEDGEVFYSDGREFKIVTGCLYWKDELSSLWKSAQINLVDFITNQEFEIKEKVPEGFVKNSFEEYVKPGKIEVWVNVYWDTVELKEQTEVYANKEDAEYYSKVYCKKYYWKFLYTKYLCQQYSIKWEDVK